MCITWIFRGQNISYLKLNEMVSEFSKERQKAHRTLAKGGLWILPDLEKQCHNLRTC